MGLVEREAVSRNCFEMCLMEGSLSVTHDVIYANYMPIIWPDDSVRAQVSGGRRCEWQWELGHGYERTKPTNWIDSNNENGRDARKRLYGARAIRAAPSGR